MVYDCVSCQSDDGVTPEMIDAKMFMSGFFGDGLKAGILAFYRLMDRNPNLQPHVIIYSNNERLQFSIAGHKTHYLVRTQTSHIQWKSEELDCLMYLYDRSHTHTTPHHLLYAYCT